MDDLQKDSACELAEMLKTGGMNCGLMTAQGTVFMRSAGAPFTDTPTMFNEADLNNAVALGLIEKQCVTGSSEWEWFVTKKRRP